MHRLTSFFRLSTLALAIAAIAAITPLAFAQDNSATPPGQQQFFSPDKQHAVRITESRHGGPGTDPAAGPFTLELTARGKVVSSFPTEGTLLKAFWSADGKYVAVNNHRKSSGDQVWVLSLADCTALRVPGNNAREFVSRTADLFPAYTFDQLQRRITFTRGWDKSVSGASWLEITTIMAFSNLKDARIQLEENYAISNGKLVRVPQIPIIKNVPYIDL